MDNTVNVVTIKRMPTTIEGTSGYLTTSTGFFCRSIELPWYENQKDISCIPTGTYLCSIHKSTRRGLVYKVGGVENRDGILFHAGNWAGDVLKHLKSDSEGCILLGDDLVRIDCQMAVTNSVNTINGFMKAMNYKPFKLIVEDIYADRLKGHHVPWGGR